jgi:hypothetical protein
MGHQGQRDRHYCWEFRISGSASVKCATLGLNQVQGEEGGHRTHIESLQRIPAFLAGIVKPLQPRNSASTGSAAACFQLQGTTGIGPKEDLQAAGGAAGVKTQACWERAPLGISTVRDHVAQMAVVIVLEPIYKADLGGEQQDIEPGVQTRSRHSASSHSLGFQLIGWVIASVRFAGLSTGLCHGVVL